ncbi:MAG: Zn-dependent alcohol dehydrogenase [Actinomycetota bacterium]
MRGAVLRGLEEKMEVRDDIELVDPGPNEVRVRIGATGVCHSDLSLQNGTLPHPMPVVPGHEGAGEVIAIGSDVHGLSEGDHVIISWVAPCGACKFCLAGQPNLCNTHFAETMMPTHFSAAGEPLFAMSGTGTFAEELVVRSEAAIKIPSDIPFDIASLVGCGVMTGAGAALNTAKVQPGSNVVVIGCGGVGISAIQGARICGAAEIVAIDVVDSKLESAKRFGATHAVKPNELNAVSMELTGGDGFDYVFECIGLPNTIRQAFDATRRGGTTVVVGAGKMDAFVQFSAFELFYTERNLKGCWYGSADVRKDFDRLLRLWRMGRLDLEGMISKHIDLSEVNEAFDALKTGEVIRQVIQF